MSERLRPEVVRTGGGFFARLLESARNLLRGRVLLECARCHSAGKEFLQTTDASGLITTETRACSKCDGVGFTWSER